MSMFPKITRFLIAQPIENPATGEAPFYTMGDGFATLAEARAEAKNLRGKVAIIQRTERCVWIDDGETVEAAA